MISAHKTDNTELSEGKTSTMAPPTEKRRDSVIGVVGAVRIGHFFILWRATWARPSLLHLVKRRSQAKSMLGNKFIGNTLDCINSLQQTLIPLITNQLHIP